MVERTLFNDFGQTLDNFRRTFDRIFEGNYPATRQIGDGLEASESFFTPAVETGWTADDLNLRFILPGVTKGNLEVTTQGNQLIVRGHRKLPEYTEQDAMFYSGLVYGRFERVVDLPNGLDLTRMDVLLHDGILEVWIPKTEVMKPKKIQITSGDSRKALAA